MQECCYLKVTVISIHITYIIIYTSPLSFASGGADEVYAAGPWQGYGTTEMQIGMRYYVCVTKYSRHGNSLMV